MFNKNWSKSSYEEFKSKKVVYVYQISPFISAIPQLQSPLFHLSFFALSAPVMESRCGQRGKIACLALNTNEHGEKELE